MAPTRKDIILRHNFKVGYSPIHGRGVFARRRFQRGDYIGTFRGEPTRRNSRHTLWVQETDGSLQGIRGRNGLRFLNHAPRPNAEFFGTDLHARRTIAVDSEITIDYGEDWDDLDGF